MSTAYYCLPLDLASVLERLQLPRCSVRESIAQHLYLMLITQFGDTRYEPEFGCQVWEQDFDAITSVNWKDTVQQSVEQSIRTYEPRLLRVRVQVEVSDFESKKGQQRIRKRLEVRIIGFLLHTDEPLEVKISLFLAPLSVD